MILFHRLKSLARWVFRRNDVEADLARELDSFVEMSAADRVHDGETPHEARRHARMDLRGVEQTKERIRTERWGVQIDRFRQDLHYGWRSLTRQRGFTVVVVLTLAIGIGVNTGIYTVVDATMLRPLPFKQPERLMKVSLTHVDDRSGSEITLPVWSYPKYETFRENQKIFEDTSLYRVITLNLTGDGEAERIRAEEISAGYFPVLGVTAEFGRTFLPEEDAVPGRDFVAVISHGLWERRFGGDPAIIGKPITLDSKKYTITGILPAGFYGLSGPAEVWVPVHRAPAGGLDEAYAHAWRSSRGSNRTSASNRRRVSQSVLGKRSMMRTRHLLQAAPHGVLKLKR